MGEVAVVSGVVSAVDSSIEGGLVRQRTSRRVTFSPKVFIPLTHL